MVPLPVNGYKRPYMINCCKGNGTQALYYAWSKIIEFDQGVAKVNLLLNRASQCMDIDSYLPYEGKVVLHNKYAESAYVRIPAWVDKKKVRISSEGKDTAVLWLNNYLVISEREKGSEVVVTFPIVKETVDYKHYEDTFTFKFKGDTVVDLSPKLEKPAYAIYERSDYMKNRAPMKQVERYIPTTEIQW